MSDLADGASLLADAASSPEARANTAHENVTLAFMVALQLLPARQRSVLILCDVLDFSANEVAAMLDFTVPAVNSALHRARVTLSKNYSSPEAQVATLPATDIAQHASLVRYVAAWERADVDVGAALMRGCDSRDAAIPLVVSGAWGDCHLFGGAPV